MQSLTVRRVNKIRLDTPVAGDKSITHRAIMLSSISGGTVTVSDYLPSSDCLATAAAFRSMGVEIENLSGTELKIKGAGKKGLKSPAGVIDCGNSGTLARILPGVIAGQPVEVTLTGDESLSRRPMKRVIEPLRKMGVEISAAEKGTLPVSVRGGRVIPLKYELPVSSAQVKTALLFASLYSNDESLITEKRKSRDHTERMFRHFGINLIEEGQKICIDGKSWPKAGKVRVPGDMSSAAFFIVLGLIHPDAKIILRRVGINPTRTGLVEKLRKMGGYISYSNISEENNEPFADLTVKSSRLRAINIEEKDVPSMIDDLPVFCLAAAFAEGRTQISGASELRVKESDRIKSTVGLLSCFGIDIKENADGMTVDNSEKSMKINGGIKCLSGGDHRIAMTAAAAGLILGDETRIEDTEWIKTSFPGFEEIINKII